MSEAFNEETLYDYQRNLEKLDVIREEMSLYHMSQALMLGHCALLTFPRQILAGSDDERQQKLRKLDLCHNHISTLPNSLSKFSNLREIWLSYNPMQVFPAILAKLPKLEVIDIRGTRISEIPTFIVDLKELVELDWRDTPAVVNILHEYHVEVNNLDKLRVIYRNINIRRKTKDDLFTFFSGNHYIFDVDKPYTASTLQQFVEELSTAFDQLDDFVSFSHRPIKFVPSKVDEIHLPKSATEARRLFYEMKRESDRKRLAADVEIKIRGKYFDKIQRSEVTILLDSIYDHVASLEDIQFLVQYAVRVLPEEVKDATGERVWHNILDLQDDLIQKREAAVAALGAAVTQLYPEQKPEALDAKAREVAKFFQRERFATDKELLRMTQLIGDVSKVFPPDFASVVAKEVVAKAHELIFSKL